MRSCQLIDEILHPLATESTRSASEERRSIEDCARSSAESWRSRRAASRSCEAAASKFPAKFSRASARSSRRCARYIARIGVLVADYGQSIPILGESIPTISLRLRPLWAASANWFFAHGSPELHTKSDTETGVVDTDPQPVATTGPLSAASCAGWSMASLTALGVTVSYDPPSRNVTASVRPDARCSEMGVGGT